MGGVVGSKKILAGGITAVVLIAIAVAVFVFAFTKHSGGGGGGDAGNANNNNNSNSNAAIKNAVRAVCSSTSYRETCETSLSQVNTTDPKELLKYAMEVALRGVGDLLANSTLLRRAAEDAATRDALYVCEDVFDLAVDEMRRSLEKVGELELSKMSEYAGDVRTWLSAVVTNQETCIDAFQNTTGDVGKKMENLMKTVREMSSNCLAIVTQMSDLASQLEIGGVRRKLMSDEPPRGWRRRLIEADRTPDAVVALDGSARFSSINDAISAAPEMNARPFVIHVKEGLYAETVVVPKKKDNIVLIGDGPEKTRITGNLNFAAGVKTFVTATVAVNARDFFARDIAVENTAGPEGHQAVALRVSGDRAVFYNVHIDGYQDTLYAHIQRQYYRNCRISGTIDFVFGDALSIFQNCTFLVRNPLPNQSCMVTAQGRFDPRSVTAIVIDGCEIRADPAFLSRNPMPRAYLGRPWKVRSRTIIMRTEIGGFIAPEGWAPWDGEFALDTLYYAEYGNTGPGSNTTGRVTWRGIQHIESEAAALWSPTRAYGGDGWITKTGIPYSSVTVMA